MRCDCPRDSDAGTTGICRPNMPQVSVDTLLTLLSTVDAGYFVVDAENCEILYAGPKHFELVSKIHKPSEAVGQPCWSFMNSKGPGRCEFCPNDTTEKAGMPCTFVTYLPHNNLWIKSVHTPVAWPGRPRAQLVTFFDITESINMQTQLENLAFIDQKLQLQNTLKFERDIATMAKMPSIIIFDIVSMQKVNEAYGRDIGDILLHLIRDWLVSLNIPNSQLYRIGGDEFCLSISDIPENELVELGKTLWSRFGEPWFVESTNVRMTIFCSVSMGVIPACFIQENDTLLNLVERTLETAREKGKLTIFDEEMDIEFKRKLQFEFSLKRCVRDGMDGFDVHYQPIANPITGTWCGLEALCRWNSPELGNVSPHTFIPEAERLELIGTIGLWALELAVSKCKSWGLDKHGKFILDVNLSAIQFTDETLADTIVGVLERYDYPGDKLCLELTESTQFTFTDLSLQTIQRLREHNILVALDDFGTGYSSFNNLKSLPIDIVKIERVFVTNIENDSYQQYLFHAMAELAHASDMKLVAEGVETKEQMDILLKNGADYLQGYLFDKPLPPAMIEKNLHRFYEVDKSFSLIRNRKIDIKTLLDAESGYILTPNMYKVLNRGMRILFYHADMNSAIDQVLKIVGTHLDLSRTYLYLRESGNTYVSSNEWLNTDRGPISRITVNDSWLGMLSREGVLLSSDIANLPPDLQDLAKQGGIKALAVIPLWENDELLGFVGFDDCRYFRDWRPEEVLLLHNLCVIITSLLSKRALKNEITMQGEVLNNILNLLDMPIYVSDVDTGKIIFSNTHMCQFLGENPTGRVCWEALYNRDCRCEFCVAPAKDTESADMTVWDYRDPSTNRQYRVHSCVIPWIGGKKAHFGYSVS